MYNNTRPIVKVNQMFSSWFDTRFGVRHGETLSPTLFNIFLNDLVNDIENLHCGMETGEFSLSVLCYVDDIVEITENEDNMQIVLDYIAVWCRKWRMKVNTKKRRLCMYAGNHVNLHKPFLNLDDTELELVSKYKYLGFFFNEHMDMKKGINVLSEAAGRSLSGIIAKFASFRDAGFQTYTKLYERCVVPIMDYFTGIWGFLKYPAIDKVHNRACRFYLGLHAKAPNPALQAEIGWMLPKYRHFLNIFKNWNRYNKMDVNRITYKVLIWDGKQKVKSWTDELRNISRILECHEPKLNVLYDLKHIKKLLCNLQTSEWKNNVLSKPKLRLFKSYKTTFDTENYVCKHFSKRKRSLFAQLRVGVLPLEVETGRYRNILPENRLCPFCVNMP